MSYISYTKMVTAAGRRVAGKSQLVHVSLWCRRWQNKENEEEEKEGTTRAFMHDASAAFCTTT